MICPIQSNTIEDVECCKEECAWWLQQCAVNVIAQALAKGEINAK